MTHSLSSAWRELGYVGPVPGEGRVREIAPGVGTVELGGQRALLPLDTAGVDALEQYLARQPEELLLRLRTALKRPLTTEDLRALLTEAHVLVENPDAYAKILESRRRRLVLDARTAPLPDKHGIPIEPGDQKFQPVEDALGWLFNIGPYLLSRFWGTFNPTAIPRPDPQGSNFQYTMKRADGSEHTIDDEIRIALFSDWGTGRYHSRYITQEIRLWRPEYAIHLGDVYYVGSPFEFSSYVTSDVDRLSQDGARVFLLNGNHEMYDGHEYFDYIARRHSTPYPVRQEQEGSYFCLTAPAYQVIGLDTAYDWKHDGQLMDAPQGEWLRRRVVDGHGQGRRSILLSQHEPFQCGVDKKNALFDQVMSWVTVDEIGRASWRE